MGSSSSSSSSNCIVASFTAPQGSWVVNASGDVYQPFNMNADFNGGGVTCKWCEYRQYVSGYFKYKGPSDSHWTTVPKLLRFGTPLSSTISNEDGSGTGDVAYGHRDQTWGQTGNDKYLPAPRATGCQYRGADAPGWHNGLSSGYQYDILLNFEGWIVDVSIAPERKVRSLSWQVAKTGTVP